MRFNDAQARRPLLPSVRQRRQEGEGRGNRPIGIFRNWGTGEDDPPGPTFQSFDGNSLDSPGGDLARIQVSPDPTPPGDKPAFLVGSWHNSANVRDAGLLKNGFFLDLTGLKSSPALQTGPDLKRLR
jgi:hypothetical protein